MLESMDTAMATTQPSSVNVSRRASMRSMMSVDFSDEELREIRDRANSSSQNGIARRLSSLRRLTPVNEFNDSEADCDEKTVIVRRPSAAMSAFDDEKEDAHGRRRRGISVPSSISDIEDDRVGYDEFVKEIRIDISGSNRSRSQASRLSPHDAPSDEDEVDKLLRRLSGQSFNKYRGTKVVAMDPETRDILKQDILGHIERLKQQYERKEEAQRLAHRQQVTLWEEKYRSLKRDHKKMKSVQRQRKMKAMAQPSSINCNAFWNFGRQNKGCVPLQPPQSSHRAVKARPYRSGKGKSRKMVKRPPKKRRKRSGVDVEKKEESEGKV